ncbi:MAG: hypothetical protein MR669_01925 [Selenomonadaceae bacterium]|nr:hypothetical protein [Selenomonadaceae bacterium]
MVMPHKSKANQLNDHEKEELAMNDAAIYDAMQAARIFLSNDAERHAYLNREMAIMDQQAQHEAAIEDGYKQGMEQGMQQGIQQGKQSAAEEHARRFLKMGLTPEQVAEGTGLSIEDVKKLSEKG